ncbi:MAG: NUDIX domain-containing protein, partial [Candidatus Omnitrophica bacterium]|nr:NUDIX domain-containing protein [Candidatus Omnitrophota bacterium]
EIGVPTQWRSSSPVDAAEAATSSIPPIHSYPLSIPQGACQLVERKYGKDSVFTDVKVNGFDLQESGQFIEGEFEALRNRLEALRQLGARAPPQWQLVITSDTNLARGNVAVWDIDSSTLYLHPYFFELSEAKQIETLFDVGALVRAVIRPASSPAFSPVDLADAINRGRIDLYNAINESWNIKMAEGNIFKYNLSKLTRKTAGRMAAMFNPDRAGRRPVQMETSSLNQPFDTGKFNFNKVAGAEIIAQGINLAGVSTDVIVNVNPFLDGHILVVPERTDEHSQYYISQVAKVAFELLRKANLRSYKVAYNSVGAFASINHLHLQALDYQRPYMPVEAAAKDFLFEISGVSIWKLKDWPLRTFVLSGENAEKLELQLSSFISILHELNQPFNIIFTCDNEKYFSAYIFPRKFQGPSKFGTGVAYLEVGGEILFVQQADKSLEESLQIYEKATEQEMAEEIAVVGLDEVAFYDIFSKFESTPSSPVQDANLVDSHHLTKGELDSLNLNESTKQLRSDERIRKQVMQVEEALGNTGAAREKAEQVISDLIQKKAKFKGEEVHILNGAGKEARVIGRVDRKIAEQYGYIHETANVVLVTPDRKKVVVQLRNKENYDEHLAMYGGHLKVGQSHRAAVTDETKEETGLEHLDSEPIFVGYEEYSLAEDNNKERRFWFVYILSERE